MALFYNIKDWWCSVQRLAVHFAMFVRELFNAVIIGVTSLSYAIWRALTSLVGKYPQIALVAFIAATLTVWWLTFMDMRVRAVGAEEERDSIAWEFTRYKERHGYE